MADIEWKKTWSFATKWMTKIYSTEVAGSAFFKSLRYIVEDITVHNQPIDSFTTRASALAQNVGGGFGNTRLN